ncbi:MAG: NrfD/PsrC family molybdoenzyme membrane anchor subunit [Candidatus Methylomirabilia bacterium]
MKNDATVPTSERLNLFLGTWGPKGYPALVGLTLLIYVYSLQWRVGFAATGVDNHAASALYLVNFLFFIGASAGGIVVGALACGLEMGRFRLLARIAEQVVISCLALATVFLVLLGRRQPEPFWHFFSGALSSSLLIWDWAIITSYLAIALALGYFVTRPDLVRCVVEMPVGQRLSRLLALGRAALSPDTVARERALLRALTLIFIPAAVLLHAIPDSILGLSEVHHGWRSALIAPVFMVSAVVSGLGLVIFAATLSRGFLRFKIGEEVIRGLGRVLFFSIPVLAYGLFAEMLAVASASDSLGTHIFSEMLFGLYAPLFWFGLFGGLMVPFLLLVLRGACGAGGIGLAAFLVTFGVLAQRWNIVIPPLLGHAHLPYAAGGYSPPWPELSLTVGTYAVGFLVYFLLARVFPPMKVEEHR